MIAQFRGESKRDRGGPAVPTGSNVKGVLVLDVGAVAGVVVLAAVIALVARAVEQL